MFFLFGRVYQYICYINPNLSFVQCIDLKGYQPDDQTHLNQDNEVEKSLILSDHVQCNHLLGRCTYYKACQFSSGGNEALKQPLWF